MVDKNEMLELLKDREFMAQLKLELLKDIEFVGQMQDALVSFVSSKKEVSELERLDLEREAIKKDEKMEEGVREYKLKENEISKKEIVLYFENRERFNEYATAVASANAEFKKASTATLTLDGKNMNVMITPKIEKMLIEEQVEILNRKDTILNDFIKHETK